MMIAFIFEVVLVMVVGCFGIVGNCLLISNFIKLKMKVNFIGNRTITKETKTNAEQS